MDCPTNDHGSRDPRTRASLEGDQAMVDLKFIVSAVTAAVVELLLFEN